MIKNISQIKKLPILFHQACCSNRDFIQYPVDIDALTLVSLLLVELISPDVMYNGLPWPDEEFTKVSTFFIILL